MCTVSHSICIAFSYIAVFTRSIRYILWLCTSQELVKQITKSNTQFDCRSFCMEKQTGYKRNTADDKNTFLYGGQEYLRHPQKSTLN